eukprot:Pgem_evm1s9760
MSLMLSLPLILNTFARLFDTSSRMLWYAIAMWRTLRSDALLSAASLALSLSMYIAIGSSGAWARCVIRLRMYCACRSPLDAATYSDSVLEYW